MIAIIRSGGKQYQVKEGTIIAVEKIEGKKGDKVSFDTLFLGDESKIEIGKPLLKKSVVGEIVEQIRADKVTIVKHQAKKRMMKKQGHRQNLTKIKIVKLA